MVAFLYFFNIKLVSEKRFILLQEVTVAEEAGAPASG